MRPGSADGGGCCKSGLRNLLEFSAAAIPRLPQLTPCFLQHPSVNQRSYTHLDAQLESTHEKKCKFSFIGELNKDLLSWLLLSGELICFMLHPSHQLEIVTGNSIETIATPSTRMMPLQRT